MGLELEFLQFIELSIRETFGQRSSYSGLRMIELGDQEIRSNPEYPGSFGKEYYSGLGFERISIDVHGKNGAIPLDLRNPNLFHQYYNTADILTNSGTTEHVEPFETQYECWQIIHDCVKAGGLMIHIVPDITEMIERASWRGHCSIYYSLKFFQTLAEECNYKLLRAEIIRGCIAVALIKNSSAPFMANKGAFLRMVSHV